MHDRGFNGIFVVVVLRSHQLPRLYLASVRRRRNGSVDVGGISRSCWRDSASSLVIYRNESIRSRAKYLSWEKDVERMGPSLVDDRLWLLERRLPLRRSISSRRPCSGHARTWHGDVMMYIWHAFHECAEKCNTKGNFWNLESIRFL